MNLNVNLVAISVGNTRTQVGQFKDGDLTDSARLDNDDRAAIVDAAKRMWEGVSGRPDGSVLLASVNNPVAEKVRTDLQARLGATVYMVEDDLDVPIGRQLDADAEPGTDRLLNAAAAYATLKQACVIVDAGTAVTVDFVDGQGTFHGGAIAPGAAMQLAALHENTAALPVVKFTQPSEEAFGRNTEQAMLHGVYHGIRGMVQRLVENYAEQYGAYPMIVATGGDAQALFGHDDLIDRVVPDLTLIGMAVTAAQALSGDQHGPMAGEPTQIAIDRSRMHRSGNGNAEDGLGD